MKRKKDSHKMLKYLHTGKFLLFSVEANQMCSILILFHTNLKENRYVAEGARKFNFKDVEIDEKD